MIIRRGDDFLLLHRAIDRYWHVIAGVVEEGETFAGAAVRELVEETGSTRRLSTSRRLRATVCPTICVTSTPLAWTR